MEFPGNSRVVTVGLFLGSVMNCGREVVVEPVGELSVVVGKPVVVTDPLRSPDTLGPPRPVVVEPS